jgi:hypothetical protein
MGQQLSDGRTDQLIWTNSRILQWLLSLKGLTLKRQSWKLPVILRHCYYLLKADLPNDDLLTSATSLLIWYQAQCGRPWK